MERVIVTGATSMIGEALIEECLKHGISVCAVIRKDTARKDRLPEDPHLELVECSLEELETLPEKVNGTFDTFYHIAWGYTGTARNKSVRLQSKNIDYTLEAVEAAAKLGCRRFIGAGSQAEYGPLDLEKSVRMRRNIRQPLTGQANWQRENSQNSCVKSLEWNGSGRGSSAYMESMIKRAQW